MRKATPKRGPRRFLQYGLRTLLGLMLLVAVLAGWYRSYVRPRLLQDEAAVVLAEKGVTLEWRSAGPDWLQWISRPLTGEEGLRECVAVHAERLSVKNADLESLHRLRWVERLYLAQTQVTDKGLRNVSGLPRLRRLSLWDTKVTNLGLMRLSDLPAIEVIDFHGRGSKACLENLSRFKTLERLVFSFSVDDESLAALASLPRLQLKELRLVNVSNTGLAELPAWPDLTRVEVVGRRYTDDGLRHFAGLPELKQLTLYHTAINGSGLRYLCRLPNLEKLTLRGKSITDEGIRYLGNQRSLTYLDIQQTGVTADSIAHLVDIKSLTSLRMASPVDDEAIRHLTGLPNLKRFGAGLYHYHTVCYLTDAGLQNMAKLKCLLNVTLRDACDGREVAGVDVPPGPDAMTDDGLTHLFSIDELQHASVYGRNVTLDVLNRIPDLSNDADLTFHFECSPREAIAESLGKSVRSMTIERHRFKMTHIGPNRKRTVSAEFDEDKFDCGVLEFTPGLTSLTAKNGLSTSLSSNLRFVPNLEHLTVETGTQRASVSAAGLLALSNLNNLRSLDLQFDESVKPSHMAFLEELDAVDELVLRCKRYTGEQLRFVAGLNRLKQFKLFSHPRSANDQYGLTYVARCPQLTSLALVGCTDVSMRYIGQMRNLEWLRVSGGITDRGLKQLGNLRQIRTIHLEDTKVTEEGYAAFKRNNFRVIVYR